jgi:hypothetical protein
MPAKHPQHSGGARALNVALDAPAGMVLALGYLHEHHRRRGASSVHPETAHGAALVPGLVNP